MNLIIIGPSGSGKGTQAELLSNRFKIPAISMGELFRQAYARKIPVAIEAQKYVLKGHWVPTKLTIKLLGPELDKHKDGFVIDGFPRLPDQPKVLEEYLKKSGRKIDKVIHLGISDKEAVKRLLLRAKIDQKIKGKARKDETKDTIKSRLKTYHHTIDPILDFYREKGLLMEIDGERPVETILEDVLRRLKEIK